MATQRSEILEEIERRRLALSIGLLRVYNYYRAVVGLALITVFAQTLVASRLGTLNPDSFLILTVGYTILNLLSAVTVQFLPSRSFANQLPALSLVLFDIVALTVLMYLSGGVSSGLGVLIIVSVATGAIIVTGPLTNMLPAVATIAVLYEEFYLSLSAPDLVDDYFQAGVLGVIYFAVSLSIQSLSQRIRDNDIRAMTQAAELADLERVNRQIIQRMRTGILLVDPANHVRMTNQSARALLGQSQDEELTSLPAALRDHLSAWREDNRLRIPPFQIGQDTPEIKVAFASVRAADPNSDVTVFIEDTGEVAQQAQQLKLAALGRLSASIAHEIRNPLGAISHAAQLLRESHNLDKGDTRLTTIIHEHCQRMNDVIENVLELSRRRPPSPSRICLKDFLETFRQGFSEAVAEASIEISVDPQDTEVRIDERQLTQALTNLAANGVRYSTEAGCDGSLRLEGGIDERTERPYLNVIDHGPGVAEEQLTSLFEPFFTTSPSGTGLGLYISRELCEANQARLTYYRHHEGGACFRITFAHPDRITG